jgi:hypothetical protein
MATSIYFDMEGLYALCELLFCYKKTVAS